MAHTATLTSLTEQLVASLAGPSNSLKPAELRQARDTAVRALRAQHYARTNQFDVHDTLNGLLEKFDILHREDLSEALQPRLKKLRSIPNKWTPELLSLLLQLSDRPLEKTKVGSLASLRPAAEAQQLTWDDILAGEPAHEDDGCEEVDYAARWSSDADTSGSDEEDLTVQTAATSEADEHIADAAHAFSVAPDSQGFDRLRKERQALDAAHHARHALPARTDESQSSTTVSELTLIRESLFMLRGFPTSLFQRDAKTGEYSYTRGDCLAQSSSTSTRSVLDELAMLATDVQSLRAWLAVPQTQPVLQSFSAATSVMLHTFELRLAKLEAQLVERQAGAVVSILRVTEDLHSWSTVLIEVGTLVSRLVPSSPYQCLELLFDRICLAQLVSEHKLYLQLGSVFFTCLNTYLRPIGVWMKEGELPTDDHRFFIKATFQNLAIDQLWDGRFTIRSIASGQADAPSFVRPSCELIFKAGKSVYFLKSLNAGGDMAPGVATAPQLTFETVCGEAPVAVLTPFSEALAFALKNWVQSHHVHSSRLVRELLVQGFDLWHHMNAFEHIYLGRDGSRMQTFASNIVEKMEEASRSWSDRFLLTELLHAVFADILGGSCNYLSVRTLPVRRRASKMQSVGSILIVYSVPRPLVNIIRDSSMSTYQKTFTFNLQLHLVAHLLTRVPDRSPPVLVRGSTRTAEALRFRMIRFSSTLRAHFSTMVVEALTRRLRLDLLRAEDVDDMATTHEAYVRKLDVQMLLSKNVKPIRTAIVQMLELCVTFSEAQALHQRIEEGKGSSRDAAVRHRRRRSILPPALATEDSGSDEKDDDTGGAEAEQEDPDYDADVDNGGEFSGPFSERVRKIAKEFSKLNIFVINGLKALSAAGGEACHEVLAERLE